MSDEESGYGEANACPKCESTELYVRFSNTHSVQRDVPKYQCRCGYEFDEPIVKERTTPGPTANSVLDHLGERLGIEDLSEKAQK